MKTKENLKKYKTYQKPNEVYFDLEEMGILFLAIIVASLIGYGLLFFLGLPIAVLLNALIAFLVYFYMYNYGKSNQNITVDFLLGLVPITGLWLFIDIGPYLLVVYHKTGKLNSLYLLIWASILIGVPVVYHCIKLGQYYYQKWQMAKNFIKVTLRVDHDRELFTYIDQIQFINSIKKSCSNLYIEEIPYLLSEKEFYKMDTEDKISFFQDAIYTFNIHIPNQTDKLLISWFSIIEDKYYENEVIFPFEQLEVKENIYPTHYPKILREKYIDDMHLFIFQKGGFRLNNYKKTLINIKSHEPSIISSELRHQMFEEYRNSGDYEDKEKAFSKLISKIRTSNDIDERHLIQHLPLPWNLEVISIEEGKHKLEIMDVSFNSYTSEMEELQNVSLRYLPIKIVVMYQGDYLYPYLTVHIHSQSLYQHIQKLTKGDHTLPIQFSVYPNSLKFVITVGNKTEIMFDFEVVIDEKLREEAEEHWYHKYTSQQINQLIREAWELVRLRKYEQAQEKCNKVIDLNPKYGFAYFLKLRLIWYQKGFEACLARMEYFINKTEHEPPALAHIYNCYGCLYDEEMMYKEALDFFEKANQLVPKMAMYVANKAEIHYKLKNRKEAVLYAKEAKEKGDSSNIVQEILKNKGKINEVDFLETQLGRLAVMYRSASDENTRKKIIEHYHETYYKMVKLNKGIIALDPDAELPDSLMPQEYVNYWLGKNND